MFKIYGYRDKLWQWDLNQKLVIDNDKVNEVHFCNGTDTCALVCEVYELDGVRVVNVPNIILQSDFNINAFAFVTDNDGCYTEYKQVFKVMPRSKPADYVYTETEVKRYEDFEERLARLEAQEVVTKEYVDNAIGDIDKALDAIIEIQEDLLGR